MGFTVEVKLDLPGAKKLAEACGFDEKGAAQRFHTANVLRRIQKYMPKVSGALVNLTISQTDIDKPVIVTEAPQAAFLYYGKLMLGEISKSAWARKGEAKFVTSKDLNFNQEINPLAGPFWDQALVANEGEVMVSELQRYIDRQKR